jgi:hypothetical protein
MPVKPLFNDLLNWADKFWGIWGVLASLSVLFWHCQSLVHGKIDWWFFVKNTLVFRPNTYIGSLLICTVKSDFESGRKVLLQTQIFSGYITPFLLPSKSLLRVQIKRLRGSLVNKVSISAIPNYKLH